MSGIAGIITFDGSPVEHGLLDGMIGAMAHRGPDGTSTWSETSAHLGHAMMCTTPEALSEEQPLVSEDGGFVLVMDGRIDNTERLRSDLLASNAKLRSRCDAELVLHAFLLWGDECWARLHGDFAIAIWDHRRRVLHCARDRVGFKPFYYHFDGHRFAFASEIRPLLELPWVKCEPNYLFDAALIAWQGLAPNETHWLGIERMQPAHYAIVDCNGMRPTCYWRPDVGSVSKYKRPEEAAEAVRAALTDAVRRLSRCHKPLGFEVSGGLDSSTLFCIADQLSHEGRLGAPSMAGYTLNFEGDRTADEIAYARAVGAHTGRKIHEVAPFLPPTDWFSAFANAHGSYPPLPTDAMSIRLYRALKATGAVTVIGGLGGDEMLSVGPEAYAEALAFRDGTALRALIAGAYKAGGLVPAGWELLRHGFYGVLPTPLRSLVQTILPTAWKAEGSGKSKYLTADAQRLLAAQSAHNDLQPSVTLEAVRARRSRCLISPLSQFLKEQMELTYASEGIEIRSPYFDFDVMTTCLDFAGANIYEGHDERALHRRIASSILPDEVRTRDTKADFNTTFESHFLKLQSSVHSVPIAAQKFINTEKTIKLSANAVPNGPIPRDELYPVLWHSFCLTQRNRPCNDRALPADAALPGYDNHERD